MRTAFIALIALLVGVTFGVTHRPAAMAIQDTSNLPSNMELYGSIATAVDKDDPLVKELEEDDARRAHEKELAERGAWQ